MNKRNKPTQGTKRTTQKHESSSLSQDADELSHSTTPEEGKATADGGNTETSTDPHMGLLGALPPVHVSAGIRPLWCYRGPLTADRTVTCMAWNRKEPDILAVGYSVKRTSHTNEP